MGSIEDRARGATFVVTWSQGQLEARIVCAGKDGWLHGRWVGLPKVPDHQGWMPARDSRNTDAGPQQKAVA